jgi:NCAIR mutase (PurE)-related protein
MNDPLSDIARQFAAGELTRDQFLDACDLQRMTVSSAGSVDVDRQRRCGFSEVIFGEGKSAEQIATLLHSLRDAGQPGLVTRIDREKANQVRQTHPEANFNALASTLRLGDNPPLSCPTGVVSAGTSDLPVAEEARETMRWMGLEPYFACDVGVAGPSRLLTHLPALRQARAVVVVAGMEGALPSVVAGHLSAPVIAVPTSVGYGASWGGLAALLGMLTSCAANVCVTNIDAGFKGGYMAGLIARQSQAEQTTTPRGGTA